MYKFGAEKSWSVKEELRLKEQTCERLRDGALKARLMPEIRDRIRGGNTDFVLTVAPPRALPPRGGMPKIFASIPLLYPSNRVYFYSFPSRRAYRDT